MNLSDQVTSLDISKKLHALGVKKESLFYWEFLGDGIKTWHEIRYINNITSSINYSAFSASELLELLPKFINDWIFRIEKYPSEYEVKYCNKLDEKRLNVEFDKNLSNAIAKMLIHLIENKIISF